METAGKQEERGKQEQKEKKEQDYGLEAVHRASLDILKEIDRICRKYGIRYMLDSGTLLGAVRHGGFIPWDDDADVAFTRDDYEAFAKVVQKELPRGMRFLEPKDLRGGTVFYDFTPRIVYMNSRTHADSAEMDFYGGALNHLWVDLFILDELPEGRLAAAWTRLLHVLVYGLAMGHRYRLDFSKYGPAGKLGVGILACAGRWIPMRTIIKMQRWVALKDKKGRSRLLYYSNYQLDYLHVTVEKDWSGAAADMPFEDTVLMVPQAPHQVLTQIYGDYLELPPEEKRVPAHTDGWLSVTG